MAKQSKTEAPDEWRQTDTRAGGFGETDVARASAPLNVDSLEALKSWGFTDDELYRIVGPRRTLARRKQLGQPLTPIEADRVRRLQRFAQHADRVFGAHEKAARWLRKESRPLDRIRPIDLLQSETGAMLVGEELHRIDYGIFV